MGALVAVAEGALVDVAGPVVGEAGDGGGGEEVVAAHGQDDGAAGVGLAVVVVEGEAGEVAEGGALDFGDGGVDVGGVVVFGNVFDAFFADEGRWDVVAREEAMAFVDSVVAKDVVGKDGCCTVDSTKS